MIANAQRMSCGNCGHNLFRIFRGEQATGGQDGYADLFVECVQCQSVTTIAPSVPYLKLGWGEGADGILCNMEGKP